jgi:general secretion pathway protein G
MRRRNKSCRGFTLIELMIVMLVIAVLLAIAVPNYTQSVIRAKESVLRQDLFTMNELIKRYTLDKQKAPQALEDLQQAGYLKKIPTDPMTGNSDWATEPCDSILSLDQQDEGGICGVHSASDQIGSDSRPYSQWP